MTKRLDKLLQEMGGDDGAENTARILRKTARFIELRHARQIALEEAARLAENTAIKGTSFVAYSKGCHDSARAIRAALAEQEQKE